MSASSSPNGAALKSDYHTSEVKRLSSAFMNNSSTQQISSSSNLAKTAAVATTPLNSTKLSAIPSLSRHFSLQAPSSSTLNKVNNAKLTSDHLSLPSANSSPSTAISSTSASNIPKISENPFIASKLKNLQIPS